VGACIAWAVDNNLTRGVSARDPITLAALKGVVAGSVNVVIALSRGSAWPAAPAVTAAAIVGFLGYGTSLALFVHALRHLGASRTGAYFSTAPFIGAVAAVVGLGEPMTSRLAVAAALMAAGVWLHLTERHDHEHVHEALTHDHAHRHDEHHEHEHVGDMTVTEPHSHSHVHEALRHRHPHYPDLHHRHGH
jgi:drug/metabolite transporter (DMT)-like permease